MSWNWNWVLLAVGALMILLEVSLGGFAGFDLVLIGTAFVLGGGIGLLVGNVATGFIVASLLCIAYIVVGRRWVQARLHARTGTSSNVDALLGQKAVVTERLSEHAPGQVRVRDEVWRARPAAGASGAYEPGAVVTVEGVDGVTLQVR